MVAPKLRRRGSWFGVADAIRSVLSDIETNVADVIDQIGRWGKPNWNHIEVSSNHQASPWDLVVAIAGCKILLPAPSAKTLGTEVCVVANTSAVVTVYPLSGSIDGGTSSVQTANRSKRYICTKTGWHSDG